jgi:predicted ATPase
MNDLVLSRLRIRNLACFAELDLRPGQSTLLLGRNGAGKSTLFDILFWLNTLVNRGYGTEYSGEFIGYQLQNGPAEIQMDVASARHRFEYSLSLKRIAGLSEVSWDRSGPDFLIERETLADGGHVLASFEEGDFQAEGIDGVVKLVQDRSPLQTVQFPEKSAINQFKRWLHGIWLLRLEPREMEGSADEAADALDVSGKNFVAWLLNFRLKRKAMAQVVAAARGSVDGLSSLRFVRAGRDYVLVATLYDRDVDFEALSDGQRCLILLHAVLVLAQKQCSLLLLDEPDAHVTSEEILPLLDAVRANLQPAGIQVVIASHHPQVIDAMAPDSPWELVSTAAGVVAEPFRVDLKKGVSASRHLLLRGRR